MFPSSLQTGAAERAGQRGQLDTQNFDERRLACQQRWNEGLRDHMSSGRKAFFVDWWPSALRHYSLGRR